MVALSHQSIKKNEGDYIGEDGLLYCGKCNTPKQVRVEILGEIKEPLCKCQCEIDREHRAEEKAKKDKHDAYIAFLKNECFPDSRMAEWTFANDDGGDSKTTDIAQRYVANFDKMKNDGKGLLFFGGVGSGKTYTSACIANALLERGNRVRVTNFATIANEIQSSFDGRDEYYEALARYDLLVIDDLLAERKTEYMSEIVYNVIDTRYRSGLPLIVTTNLTSEELKNPADITYQRIFSRLLEMCIPIKVSGADRRRKILINTYKDYADILGLKEE